MALSKQLQSRHGAVPGAGAPTGPCRMIRGSPRLPTVSGHSGGAGREGPPETDGVPGARDDIPW